MEEREPEGTEVTSAAEETTTERPYETRSWSGLPQYICTKCGFDTFKQLEIERHVKDGCRPNAKPRKRARRSRRPPRFVLRRTEKE